jgi:hypothetical protein
MNSTLPYVIGGVCLLGLAWKYRDELSNHLSNQTRDEASSSEASSSEASPSEKEANVSHQVVKHSFDYTQDDVKGFIKSIQMIPKSMLTDLNNDVIIDPAGLKYIQANTTEGAGALSGQIYKTFNIKSFPNDVKQAIQKVGDASTYTYDKQTIIHVVGPMLTHTNLNELETAYYNVFREILKLPVGKGIRLIPISGGVFANNYVSVIHILTYNAIARAYTRLSQDEKTNLKKYKMVMYLYTKFEQFQFHMWPQ